MATGETFCEVSKHTAFAPPVVTDAIPVFAIPFSPTHGETTHLIAPLTDIPRFGNQFYVRENRILIYDVEKCTQFIYLMKFTCKGRRQVESKSIHVHFSNPVAQAVHD